MKKISMLLCVFLLAGALAADTAGTTLFVATRSLLLKSSPWFFAGTVAEIYYGESVTVLQASGHWLEVRSDTSPSLSGWARLSSLSASPVLSAGSDGLFREAESALDFSRVDRLSEITVNEAQLFRFLEDGGLGLGLTHED
ncbi:MAG: hypothetical protein FWG66_08680 [Spirochaetes bacterium]|nr:hypothetical protein [Spirochaetota bacterium]